MGPCPWTLFMARSLALARFLNSSHYFQSGAITVPMCVPDLGRFSWAAFQRLPLGGSCRPKVTDKWATRLLQRGNRNLVRRQRETPFLKGWVPNNLIRPRLRRPPMVLVASPGPDRTVPGLFDPKGRLWGGWEIPVGYPNPLPSNGLAREGTSRREFRRPQPAEKDKIIFSPGMYRGKYSSHLEPASPARFGVHPNFGRASHQAGNTPVLCPPERRQTPGAPLRNSSATAAAPTPAPPAPPG